MKRISAILILFIIILISKNSILADQENSNLLYEQGLEAFKSGNYGSSELLFRKILEEDNHYKDQAWYYLALSIFHQKKYKAAIFEFNRYLLISNSNQLKNKSRFWIAECLYFRNSHLKAIEEYKRFISQNKLKDKKLLVKSLERIGEIYYKRKRYDEAIIEWNKAFSITKKRKRKLLFKLKIANALFLNKNYQKAKTLLIPLSKNKKDKKISYLAFLSLGRIYQIEKKYKVALNLFSKIPQNILKEYPYYNAQYFKGICAYSLNDISSAKAFLESFLLVGKKSKWFLYAKYYLGKIIIVNNSEEGINILKEVLQKTTNKRLYSNASYSVAENLVKNNKLSESIIYFKLSLNHIEKDKKINVLFQLGNIYLETKQYDNAKILFLKMIQDYPFAREHDKMQFLLAITYLKMKDFNEANKGFLKIRDINPFSIYLNEANYFLALSQYKQNNLINTEKLLKKYLKKTRTENRYKAFDLLLDLYIKQNNIIKAQRTIAIVIKEYLSKRDISKQLLNMVVFMHNVSKNALKYENILISKYPYSRNTAVIYKIRGNKYYNNKKYQQAVKYFTLFLKINTNEYEPAIFIKKAYCYFYLKKYEQTINFLKKEKFSKYDANLSNKILLLISKAYYHNNDLKNSYNYIKLTEYSNLSIKNKYFYFKLALKIHDITQAKFIALNLNKDDTYYPKILLEMGNYYKNKQIIIIAKDYYESLVTLYGNTLIGNYAYIELIKISIDNNDYITAELMINNLTNKKIVNKKIVLTGIIYYKLNKTNKALDLLINNSKKIIKEEEGEELLKLVIKDLSQTNDIKKLKYLVKLLTRYYPNNKHFSNFYLGNYYYNNKLYKYSFYYYNNISLNNFKKKDEVNYKLGLLSLHFYNNKKKAIKYFKKIKNDDKSNLFKIVQIELAILLYETGKTSESKNILKKILDREKDNIYSIQAQNLLEYYGL